MAKKDQDTEKSSEIKPRTPYDSPFSSSILDLHRKRLPKTGEEPAVPDNPAPKKEKPRIK